jgi:hypothetical protein
MKRTFIKRGGVLIPCDPPTKAAFIKAKEGSIFESDWKKKNHPEFHAKLMMLFVTAFEYWKPGEISTEYGAPEKNFDHFRKEVTKMAGFYYVVYGIDGSFTIEAKSLKFSKMDNDEREQVYQKVLTVICEKIFPQFVDWEVEGMAQKYWDEFLGGFA